MSPARTTSDSRAFIKRPECLTSDVLLAYTERALTGLKREGIRLHLAHCDFCRAEVQLLGKHPPVREVAFVPAPLPLSLLLIAEQSLPKRHVLKKPLRRRAA